MIRYALRIEYDGAPFSGWQRQRDVPSVQGALEEALAKIGEPEPAVAAAGRTDAGVHATHQVAQADLRRDWEPFRLSEALNHHMRPLPVAITACAVAPEGWHARFSAVGRRYLYRILSRRAPPVMGRGYVWHNRCTLRAQPMRLAADMLEGHHDFTTFRSTGCQAASPVKTLDRIGIERVGEEWHLSFAARSFLHNQVRSLVGTLERVGAGSWEPERARDALEARDRAACGPVAPPEGLCLTGVVYPKDPFGDGKDEGPRVSPTLASAPRAPNLR